MVRNCVFWGLLVAVVLFVFSFLGCGGGGGTAQFEEQLSGELGQILIITANPITGEPFADSIKAFFGDEYPYIPQVEPKFDVLFMPIKNFDGVFRSFRNILVLDWQKDTAACAIYSANDRWAKGQEVVYVVGSSAGAVWQHMRENRYRLEQIFEQAERHRLISGYSRVRHKALSGVIARKFGVQLDIPQSMIMRVDTTDFVWVSLETPDISQGIVCYSFPCAGFGLYSKDTLVARRNAFTQKYIPGPNPGTYMKVADVLPPEVRHLRFGEDSLVCMRGLWEVHGHPMGGAFISYARLNGSRDSVIVTDGYIYAPRFNKRDYMRQLDAILLSHVVR